MKITRCPKCQTMKYVEDEGRYLVCSRCGAVKCPGCYEWIMGLYDGYMGSIDALDVHYYLKKCLVTN